MRSAFSSSLRKTWTGWDVERPLSPYPFLIVHSMIFYDVDHQLTEEGGMMPWVFSPMPLLRPCLRGRHGPGSTHSRESLLLKSHASRNHVYNAELRIYNAVFIPMLTYGMESASLSQHDLHTLEAFHSKALRKMHRIPATFYTKILEPTQPTTTNQQLREQTSQPPLTHHIHRAQLQLLVTS